MADKSDNNDNANQEKVVSSVVHREDAKEKTKKALDLEDQVSASAPQTVQQTDQQLSSLMEPLLPENDNGTNFRDEESCKDNENESNNNTSDIIPNRNQSGSESDDQGMDLNGIGNRIRDHMPLIIRSFLHIVHGRKSLFLGIGILAASIFGMEEVAEEISHFHHNHQHEATRLDLVTGCAKQLSKSVGVHDEPFNGGATPQMKAIDWFVSGPGRTIDIPTNENACAKTYSNHKNDNDITNSLFLSVYPLVVFQYALQIPSNQWSDSNQNQPQQDELITNMKQVCRWHRIQCDDHDKYITKLHFSNIVINNNKDSMPNGYIPAEMSKMAYLERIELYDNHYLTGTIPFQIGYMSNLRYLYLHHTSLTGSIPSTFSYLTNLEEVFLEDTNLSGTISSQLCALKKEHKGPGILHLLHADCAGDNPLVQCTYPTCCTNCYRHPSVSLQPLLINTQ